MTDKSVTKRLLGSVSEAAFQAHVIALAKVHGWTVAHFRPVKQMRRDGTFSYLTPVQADGAGFPDLVLVRGEQVVFAELKAMAGRPSADQKAWLESLGRATTVSTHLWKPSDWNDIEEVLA